MALKPDNKAGKSSVFTELYNRWYTPIFRFISARCASKTDAEDLMQTIFMKVWRGVTENRVTNSLPMSYIYTLARNTLIDSWRAKKHEHLDDKFAESLPDTRPLILDALSTSQELQPVLSAMADLPKDQREVIMLKFFDELETKEIANLLNKNEATIRQMQSRGLRAIKKQLEKTNA